MPASPPFLSPESLLAQSRFLRPMVRALLRDGDLVDDVLQEAVVRAWQAPATERRSWAWFARIAQNLSFDRLRARRRAERLRADAVEAEAPSTDEVLAQEEVRQRLVRAVLSLPQPYRGIVLLRFWEDLTSAAIARRLQVPGATVRSQLARGLQLLRERLDAEPGGRAAWHAAVLPCAGWHVGAAVTLATRILLMTKSKLALVVMVLVALGLGLWWTKAITPVDPSVGGRPVDRPAAGAVALGEAPPQDVVAPLAATAGSDRAAVHAELRVRGRVTHRGQPFAGLTATLQWFDGFVTEGVPAATFVVTSDAAGVFEWRGPMRRQAGMVRAVAAPTTVPAKLWCTPELVLPGEAEAELAVSVIPLDRVVSGRVHTREGAPIEGARLDVNLWSETEVVSDADGRYELRVPAPGYPMTVRAAGFAERLIDGFLPEGSFAHEFDVELTPGAAIAGRVVDPQGAPVVGAKVMASGAMHAVATGPDGTFLVDGVRAHERHRLAANKPGFQPGSGFAVPGQAPVDIVLLPGHRVDLRVRDEAGAAIAGAVVHLVADPTSGWRRLGITAVDGTFPVLDVPSREVELVIERRGFLRARQAVDPDQTYGELVVTLAKGWSIRGRVLDPSGAPVTGASIYCERQGVQSLSRSVGTRDDSDAEGRFEVRDLPAEPCTVFAYHPDFARGEVPFVGGALAETEIRLVRALAFAGRVVDGVTSAPITQFTIEVEPDPRRPVFVAARPFAASDGGWRFTHPQLPPGVPQRLVVSAPGYAPASVVSTPTTDPVADHTLVHLFAGVTVTGVVRDPANGEPLAGVTVALVTSSEWARPNDGPATDASGRFSIAGVPAGERRLRLQHADRPEVVFGPFVVARGPGTLEVNPAMGGGVAVRGRVVGGDASGRTVSAFRRDGRVTKATVDATGGFELQGLGVGDTTLHVRDRTGRVRTVAIAVGEVDLVGVELPLRSGSGAVRVAIHGDLSGELEVRRLDPGPGDPRTCDAIEFDRLPAAIDGLAPGRYRVTVTSTDGKRSGSADVDVGAGEVEVRLELRENG